VIMRPLNVIMGPWNVNNGTCNVIMGPWNVNMGLWNVNRERRSEVRGPGVGLRVDDGGRRISAM
jgi:hypothetical protein